MDCFDTGLIFYVLVNCQSHGNMKEQTQDTKKKTLYFKIKNAARCQCFGYGMFIADPDFFYTSRISVPSRKRGGRKKIKEFPPI